MIPGNFVAGFFADLSAKSLPDFLKITIMF
jgi:hypothetical protein